MPIQRIKSVAQRGWRVYDRYRIILTPAYFLVGFLIDWKGRRIDLAGEQIILILQVTLAACCLILYQQFRFGRLQSTAHRVYLNWYRGFSFFFIGGLFTRNISYYFHSSAGIKSAAFIGILILIVLLGEVLKRKLPDWYLQWALYYMGLFSFMIFFLPIVTHEMNPRQFLISGLLSFIVIALLLVVGSTGIRPSPFWKTIGCIVMLHGMMTLAYFMNWIPPVPLALKHAGIYHHVGKEDGQYRLTAEAVKERWIGPSAYYFSPGETVYCFASVFAPTQMNKTILHEWRHYEESSDEWRLVDRLQYTLVGGRDGGYRGFTAKSAVNYGWWQIDIVTEDDLLIGSLRFDIRPATPENRKFRTVYR